MKKYINKAKKKAFLTIDLIICIAIFSLFSAIIIRMIVGYEHNIIIQGKKEEMNFYIESIINEIRYSSSKEDIEKLYTKKYINRNDINNKSIEKYDLTDITKDNVEDEFKYVELKVDTDNFAHIKYVNNKLGVHFQDEVKIKIQ